MDTREIIKQYCEVIDDIYGIYLDATKGFIDNKTQLEVSQLDSINKLSVTLEYLDSIPFAYGVGDPNISSSYVLHRCTQGEYKIRNDKDGKNFATLGNLCITQLYQYWEDFYRTQIAKSVGLKKNDLNIDIFGDLRLFRHSIIHHQAIALIEIEQCKEFCWFKKGDKINLTERQIEEIIYLLKKEMDILANKFVAKGFDYLQ